MFFLVNIKFCTIKIFAFLWRIQRHNSSRSEWLPHLTNVILPDLYTYISSSSLLGELSVPFKFVLLVRVEYPRFHSDSVVERTEGDLPWFKFDFPKRPRRKCRNLIRNSRLNFSCNVKLLYLFVQRLQIHLNWWHDLFDYCFIEILTTV